MIFLLGIALGVLITTHALIYTDGCIVVTLYECCYAAWYLRGGALMGGTLWKIGDYCLAPESIEKIRARIKGVP